MPRPRAVSEWTRQSRIGGHHGKDFDVAVGEVDPVMDGVARADGNLDPSSNRIVLEIVGKTVGSRPEAREMVEQAFPGFYWQGAQRGNDFQINEEAIRHGGNY